MLGSPDREGESWTRTLMRFENGQVATLEMGGYPGAFYVREPLLLVGLLHARSIRSLKSSCPFSPLGC